MQIKKLTVKSLYELMDFEWEFDKSVNILAGINGTYKTTLLSIIQQITRHENVSYPVASVEAEYTDGIKLVFTRRVSDVQTLLANRETNRVVVEMIEKEHPDWLANDEMHKVQLNIVSYREEKDGKPLDKQTYESIIKIDFVSTFDVASDRDKESVLNANLRKLQEQYAYYLSDLAKQVSDKVQESGNVTKEQVDIINKNRNEFIAIVNETFKETGKTLSENESSLSFVKDNSQRIQLYNLSAGEKQLLIILLTALLERRQEYILIMDEPEISMHIDMQYTLIDNLLKLNPNAQIIVSTHSPAIFGSGWGDKVVYSECLLKKKG
ncbi:MAG: ATP-binding protein [Bacteroidaceae bacterium]|nr:ATP-binding protein [Bacteroidaceae bacterium]